MQYWFRRVLNGFMICVVSTGASLLVRADEPYEKFLQKLRDEQLFELALSYLSQLEVDRKVSPQFKADLDLERGLLLYQSAVTLSRSQPERAARLDEAEQSLRDFLQEMRNHPRRGEARLKVGELLLQRAEEAKSAAKLGPGQDNPQAIAYYDEAHQLFEATIQELAEILERIKGARTDANDKAAVAYRQKIEQDLRQAQLLSAKSVEERGRSRAGGSREQQDDLKRALTMFSDLYSKEQRMIGVRNYALFYRSAIQSTLDLQDDAIDGYQRIADLEGVDVLRPLQTKAVQELAGLLAQQGKFPVAVDRVEKWLAGLRPDERNAMDTLNLRLELAKIRIQWSEDLLKKDANDRVASRLVRDTRGDLRSLLRIAGPHLAEARELLAKLGVETTAANTDELPQVASFAEAIAAAQEKIDLAENDSLGAAVMREQGEVEKAKDVEQAVSLTRQQAIQLLTKGLQLFTAADDRSQLDQARFSLSYLLLKEQNPWEAVAIAEFIARKNPRTERGLNAAAITLGGLSDLLRTAGDEERQELTALLEPFARFLVTTWPDSNEASAAASALVQLALMNERWDQVEDYLKLAPTQGPMAIKLRRDAGLSLYSRYLQEKRLAGEETESSQGLKSLAMDSLKIATQDLTPESMDDAAMDAVSALARLYLVDDRVAEASQLLFDGNSSPIKLLEENAANFQSKVAMNGYRTAIQLVISQLASGQINSSAAVSQTGAYIKRLQTLAAQEDSGPQTLAGIFVALAKDLKGQLAEAQDPGERKRLSESMVILAKEAAKADAFSTQFWAADTILSTAEELSSDPGTRPIAIKAFADAAAILEGVLARESSQPGFIQPEGWSTQIRLLLAKAKRGSGDFRTAVEELSAILEENSGLLDVQIETARTLQAWGDESNLGFHKVAYLGGNPKPGTRDNVIWGWGKIARVLEGKSEYDEQFYLARYELARSRYKYATSLKEPDKKQAELGRAERDIIATATLYPQLGGPAMKKKYDALLRVIQKALEKEPSGLLNP